MNKQKDSDINNKRIAKNTLFLYFRMFLLMLIGLYTSRVVLKTLGVTDYGIYNVVGGVVGMFAIVSSSLSVSISRYLTFELGKSDINRLKTIFSTSVSIQILMGLIILILVEVLGTWFLYHKMVIPANRMTAAYWVLQFSLLAFIVGLISVPYNASIIAHEKMSAFAYISIIEGVGKLAIAFLILVSPIDKLVFYAFLLMLMSLFIRFIYGKYCGKHFEECHYHMFIDKKLLKEMVGFAGWSSFSSIAYTCYNTGLNILLNLFFGPVVNAARGIMAQVQNAVKSFSSNFLTAINPQIIKSYAANDLRRVYSLVYEGSKFSFYLLYILALPIIIKTEKILSIWLSSYPEHTVNFIRLILAILLIDSFGNCLYTTQMASGKIKNYQIITGGMMLLILPIAYLCLKVGMDAESVFVVYLIILAIVQICSIYIVHITSGMPIRDYINRVIVKCMIVVATSLPISILFNHIIPDTLIGFIIVCFFCVLVTMSCIYLLGLTKSEKAFVTAKSHELIIKLRGFRK